MTPRPMRRHRASLVRRPICRLRRKKMGNMAQIKSVMMEHAIHHTVSVVPKRAHSRYSPPCAIMTPMICRSERHTPSTPTSQYAFNGRQTPMNMNIDTPVNMTKHAIKAYIPLATSLESSIRRRKRQMEILVRPSVKKTWTQSAQLTALNIRR